MAEREIINGKLRSQLLAKTPAFKGIPEDEVSKIVELSDAKDAWYEKGQYVLREGNKVSGFGIILQGIVQGSRQELDGTRIIYRNYCAGDLLAADVVFSKHFVSAWDLKAVEDVWIVWIEVPHSMEVLSRRCVNHSKLLHNIIHILAERNVALTRRTTILLKKTIRERVLCYLKTESEQCGEKTFSIPFTRDEMADYLGVDRSALSRTLSAMKKDGVISFEKKYFTINI